MNCNLIKENGVVFTPVDLAHFMSKNAILHIKKNKNETLTILEPSAGDGALAYEAVKCALKNGFKKIKLFAFDINQLFLDILNKKISNDFPSVSITCICQDFVEFACQNDSLKADLIISNPPYVRTQNMKNEYLKFAKTKLMLKGRIDLYHIFMCLLNNMINKNGIISIVVSNKFISNKAGQSLRNYIENNFSIFDVYDFGDTKLFNASVLPAVMIMTPGKSITGIPNYISIYSIDEKNNIKNSIFEALKNKAEFAFKDNQFYKILYGKLEIENNTWSIKTIENKDFIELAKLNTKYIFGDFAKIKVGIKTTADKVFISNKWDELKDKKPELLRKLITHRVANQYFATKSDNYMVLYPYLFINGKKTTVNLDNYPITKNYLISNYKILNDRKYIQESKKQWFEIWVPHSPEKWNKKTIVFRDITEHPTFWLSEEGSVINGDCYWFDFKNKVSEDIIYLILAIANSKFIEKYYDIKFNNKLYSGRRRFMTQYVEKFPIFSENTDEAKRIISILKKAATSQYISTESIEELNRLVSLGFSQKN